VASLAVTPTCSDGVSLQGGCVGKDGYDEVLACTYSGKLCIIYSIRSRYGDVIELKQAALVAQLISL